MVRVWEFFLYVLTHGLWVSSFALFAEKQLSFTAKDVGFVFAMIGAVSILLRLLILPKLLNKYAEEKLRIIGAISIIFSLIVTPWISSGTAITISAIAFTFGASILRPSLVSYISRQASAKKQGEVMGITDSLGSISQIIGPLVGGFLIQSFFPGSLGIVSAAVMTIGLIVLIIDKKTKKS